MPCPALLPPALFSCYDTKVTSWSLARQVSKHAGQLGGAHASRASISCPVPALLAAVQLRFGPGPAPPRQRVPAWPSLGASKHAPSNSSLCPMSCAPALRLQMQAEVVNGPTTDGWLWSVPPFRWSQPVAANLTHRRAGACCTWCSCCTCCFLLRMALMLRLLLLAALAAGAPPANVGV